MEYKLYTEIPESKIMDGILKIHQEIFEDTTLPEKAESKEKILFFVAVEDGRVAGYKIGYEVTDDHFYSWYGAVNPEDRGKGIATELMKRQHTYLKDIGYKIVSTKTRNKWREMLILNIKHGFDVMETFVDGDGIHRIVLEKQL
ncbi:GNAT family N-acetyltransferase [Chungangia koreensis]|uniref:GNAT family N-acetyltransferase n=1 Tax=Chungangia koreensis TaxID=752657 RepID=A0ABV8X960_9LACT